MARLSDFSRVVRTIGLREFCRRVWRQIFEDNIFTWASALAYSWLFAIFPFFIFLLTLVPLLPESRKDALNRSLGPTLHRILPQDAYKMVWEDFLRRHLNHILHERPKGFLSIGLLLAIWSASGGMSMTMSAMNVCYDITKSRNFYKHRLLAILLTMIIATMIIAVIVLLPVAGIVRDIALKYSVEFLHWEIPTYMLALFDVARYALALVLLFLSLALLYYFGPMIKHPWRALTPGSVFCVTVWLMLGWIFRVYVDKFGKYEQTYGAVGGAVILLLFFYVDAVVLLIGAEINSEIDFEALNLKPGSIDFHGKPWAHVEAPKEIAVVSLAATDADHLSDSWISDA